MDIIRWIFSGFSYIVLPACQKSKEIYYKKQSLLCMRRISRNRAAVPDDVLCFFIFDKYENGYENFGYFRHFCYCYKICLFAARQGDLNGQSMGDGIGKLNGSLMGSDNLFYQL